MVKVLFVCLGNICRSPMAEAVFRQMVKEAGLEHAIMVDSAGTSRYHIGEPAHSGTLRTLQKHNIKYDGRARQLQTKDFKEFDYILAMDYSNLEDIEARMPSDSKAKVKLFLDYAPQLTTREVPDPYYNGRFEDVYELVKAASAGLLQAIREEHGL
ncbi:MAG: low molecular weight phosphotyrosine protein phosphatase [Phototrophicales bacterium]|nr:MAG: low molecular weight phosphotyrosine protein phosphatase [Phototrophicales bacterium]